jgi:hypothetical protein
MQRAVSGSAFGSSYLAWLLPGGRGGACALLALLAGCMAGREDLEDLIEGRLQLSVLDQEGGESRLLYMLQSDTGDETELQFDTPAAGLATGTRLRVHGRLLPALAAEQPIHDRPTLLVRQLEVLEAAPESSRQALVIDPARRPLPRKLAVVLFNFRNDTRQPMTPQEMQRKIFLDANSAREFYKEQSYGLIELGGKTGPQGEVFGYYTIPSINRPCNYGTWGEQALTAARAAGVDTTGFDYTVFFFPATDACGFLGVGQQPGNVTWMNGLSVATFIHELGHNVGTPHASARICTGADGQRITLGSTCVDSEYGNPFDVMGAGFRHTHAYNKAQARWLSGQNIQIVNADGLYTLLAQERPSDGVQLLRVQRDESTFYYLEYRQPFGFDNFPASSAAVSGVIVVIGRELRGLGNSFLLDMAPQTTTLADAPLQLGKSFDDPRAGVRLTVVGLTPESARVEVKLTPPAPATSGTLGASTGRL